MSGRNVHFVTKLALAAAGSLILILPAYSQTQAINGSIRGHVTDAAGSAVPKAKVSITNPETGFTRATDTEEEGLFVFPNLPLGTYTVTVQKEGFTTQRHTNIVVDAGVEAVIDSQLAVGSVSTTVEVTGGVEVIEPSRVNTGRTIDHSEVDNLPLTSRNPYNFIVFQVGVSGHPNAELGIPRTLNTNGLLDRINYQMDGMVNTETDRYGLRLFPISDIYVREVQTVSNSFAPEFGQTAGNIFNVITNSGSNAFHGEGYFIGRPPDASARPLLLAARRTAPPIDLHDYAINSGGPIIKDKLFIFGGYEHLLRGLPMANTINPDQAAQIGLPPSQLVEAPAVQHAQFLNLRLDWNINQKHQVFVRYNYFRNEYPFNSGVGGVNALNAAADFHDRAHIAGLQLLSTFSPTLLNELRGSIPYRNEAHLPDPLTGPGPQIMIPSIATFNGTSTAVDRFAEKIPSLSDNLTWIKGTHTLKAGFGFQENNDNQVQDAYTRYTFSSIANYLAAASGVNPFSYTTFSTFLGVPGAAYKSHFYDFFVQDSWQLRSNLLVMYGVRYDRFQAASGEPNAPFRWTRSFDTPGKDWAPRLGIAWSFTPKTVLRVNAGIFYEAPPTNDWFNSLANDGTIRSSAYSLQPTSPGAPAFPSVVTSVTGSAQNPPGIYATTTNFKNAYTINTSLQITRQLSQNDSLTVGYVHTGARDLGYLRNMNLINPVGYLADGRPIYSTAVNANTRLYPQFNGITLQDVGASSNYNAMIVNLTHRVSRGFSLSASYTWSHTISDAPDANSFEQNLLIEDPTNRERDRGNSIINRPNALNVSSVIEPGFQFDNKLARRLANGNQLTILVNLSSGDQQNITANPNNLNGDSIATAQRPLFVGRDTLRTAAVFQMDARYTRTVFSWRERLRIKLLAEGNNVTNHRNYTMINNAGVPVNAQGVPTFPAVFTPAAGTLEGRIIQLGIRTDW
jgi:Carboxypeptidase regulatory-like domain/TonB dependent receptor